MPKKTVITKTELDEPELLDQAAPVSDPETFVSPEEKEDERIQDIFKRIGGEGLRFTISRYLPSGRPQYVGDADIDNLSEANIQSAWGEGRYKITAWDSSNNYKGSKVIHIGPPSNLNKKDEEPVKQSPHLAYMDPAVTVQLEMMREEQATNRALMMKMIESMTAGKSGTQEIAEVMGMLKTVMEQPKQPSAIDLVTQILPLIKEFASLVAGGKIVSEKRDWIDTTKEILHELPNVLKMMGAQKAAVAAPPQAGNGGAGSPAMLPRDQLNIPKEHMFLIQQGLGYLKKKALQGSDPDIYINWALDNLDTEYSRAIVGLLNRPFDEIILIDPELNNIEYKNWFEDFFGGLKNALSERIDAGRNAGDQDNPSENEGTGDPGVQVGSKDKEHSD